MVDWLGLGWDSGGFRSKEVMVVTELHVIKHI